MKMIISLTFLGILMLAFAEVNSETCTLMEAAKNFDENKYFSIPLAYATHSQNREPETTVCRDYRTTKTDGKIVTTFTINDKIAPKDTQVSCINTPTSKGQFSSECTLPAGTKVKVTTSILATDNANYAVLQRCPESGPGNILVLQKNKNGAVEKGVEEYFKQKKWDINTWLSRKSVGC